MVESLFGLAFLTFHARCIWTYCMFWHDHFNQNNDRGRHIEYMYFTFSAYHNKCWLLYVV